MSGTIHQCSRTYGPSWSIRNAGWCYSRTLLSQIRLTLQLMSLKPVAYSRCMALGRQCIVCKGCSEISPNFLAFSCLSCHWNHLCKVQRPWIKSQGDRPFWVWLVVERAERIIPDLFTLLLQDKYYLWMCYQDCHFRSCNTHRRIQLFLSQPIKPRRALRKTYHRLLAFWVQPQVALWIIASFHAS